MFLHAHAHDHLPRVRARVSTSQTCEFLLSACLGIEPRSPSRHPSIRHPTAATTTSTSTPDDAWDVCPTAATTVLVSLISHISDPEAPNIIDAHVACPPCPVSSAASCRDAPNSCPRRECPHFTFQNWAYAFSTTCARGGLHCWRHDLAENLVSFVTALAPPKSLDQPSGHQPNPVRLASHGPVDERFFALPSPSASQRPDPGPPSTTGKLCQHHQVGESQIILLLLLIIVLVFILALVLGPCVTGRTTRGRSHSYSFTCERLLPRAATSR